jgi:plasmid maintenance system antidote protein VapI
MLFIDRTKFRARLALKGLTQTQLATAIGVDAPALSRMVRQRAPVPGDVAARLAAALGVAVADVTVTYAPVSA